MQLQQVVIMEQRISTYWINLLYSVYFANICQEHGFSGEILCWLRDCRRD